MKILLSGILGHMGREVVKLCEANYRGASLFAGVDPMVKEGETLPVFSSFSDVENTSDIDCIVDFSHHSATAGLISFAEEKNLPVVVATTGHTEEEIKIIKKAANKIPVFYSYNMSLGIALLVELAKKTAAAMPEADIEIIEKHHNRKVDAPSGTAIMLANAIKEIRADSYVKCGREGQGKRELKEIGVHSLRMGNIVGEHEVIISSANQTLSLKHEAHSRTLFAEGALAAAEFLVRCDAGMYDMNSLVNATNKEPIYR